MGAAFKVNNSVIDFTEAYLIAIENNR